MAIGNPLAGARARGPRARKETRTGPTLAPTRHRLGSGHYLFRFVCQIGVPLVVSLEKRVTEACEKARWRNTITAIGARRGKPATLPRAGAHASRREHARESSSRTPPADHGTDPDRDTICFGSCAKSECHFLSHSKNVRQRGPKKHEETRARTQQRDRRRSASSGVGRAEEHTRRGRQEAHRRRRGDNRASVRTRRARQRRCGRTVDSASGRGNTAGRSGNGPCRRWHVAWA